jgi:hypothetical protein
METGAVAALPVCPKCRHTLKDTLDWGACPSCEVLLHLEVFPALFRRNAPGGEGEVLVVEGESSCFYHANKKAVLPCQGCGRFLCALCDCELHGQHFCPACLESGRNKRKIKSLENHRTMYDSIALALAVLPIVTIVFWFLTIITAPMALFVAIRYWNAPRSLVHRTKVRYVLAMILATLQIGAWGLGIYYLTGRLNG